ncbi:MAG: hypothetical protein ACMXYG_00345 [Candidatus Woesearchaeota archaeon]
MDSYEKIRKMGEISEQLKKHGLVKDSDDALKQAEDMMKDQGNEFYVPREKIEEMKNKKMEPSNSNDMTSKIVNDRLSSMESQISLVRDKVNEIIAKLNEFESKLSNHEKQEIQATLLKKNDDLKDEVKKQQTQDNQIHSGVQPEQKSSTSQVTPEVKKEYSPSDVSVDKMFYVGKK